MISDYKPAPLPFFNRSGVILKYAFSLYVYFQRVNTDKADIIRRLGAK